MSPLWPLWLFFFQNTPPPVDSSFEEMLDLADFKIRLDENSNHVKATSMTGQRESLITFENPILARHVRIQLEPADVVPLLQGAAPGIQQLKSLCLAEIQIFEHFAGMIMNYRGGSPIVPGHYVSETSLTEAFRDTTIGGTWMLSLRDTQVKHQGSFDDFQLLVTDQYGVEHIYYTDLHASVLKLPVHGTLHRVNTAAYGVSGSDRGEKLGEVYGEVVSRSNCYGDCAHRFEVGLAKSAQRQQARAAFNWILGERLLVYVPNQNFIGEDSFSYRLGVRGSETAEEGTIRVRVKDCRSTIEVVDGVETRIAVTTSRDIISGRSSTFCHDDPGNEIMKFDWASRGAVGLSSRAFGVDTDLPHPDSRQDIPDNPTFYNPRCVDGNCATLTNLGTTHTSIGTEPPQPVYYSYHHPGNHNNGK